MIAEMTNSGNNNERNSRESGPWAASLTPIKNSKIDAAKLVKHIQWF